MKFLPLLSAALATGAAAAPKEGRIDRQRIVRSFNPHRTASSDETPLQVGNGNFAFGADVTGLQTFRRFATMSTWGWHSHALPEEEGQNDPEDFHGVEWPTHGRDVFYNIPNADQPVLSNWLRENPHRINLATIGFSFPDPDATEADLASPSQTLDLWTGVLTSSFQYEGADVRVETVADPASDAVAVTVKSSLLEDGALGLLFDFSYPTKDKFDAPFVGLYNRTDLHETTLTPGEGGAEIRHVLGETEYGVSLRWDGDAEISGPENGTHRYRLTTTEKTLRLTASFGKERPCGIPSVEKVRKHSEKWWEQFWKDGAFVDLSKVEDEGAKEIQRRAILSLYLIAVNSASDLPPQESGLVNNGWYGKFHMEMYLWHGIPFALWNHRPLLDRSLSHIYTDLLPHALALAERQGYTGARWGKMTGPDFSDAPGEINAMLIWQQPHPMYFAETELRGRRGAASEAEVLEKWDEVLTHSADFMASYAWLNESSGFYDLGAPLLPASENTDANATRNPTFELAYWRFGLDVAIRWKTLQGLEAPSAWLEVRDGLAPLPTAEINSTTGPTFPIYEGVPNMWTDNATTMDHPAMTGIYGLLPPPLSGPPLDIDTVRNTAEHIKEYWDLDQSFGWDFPMLAMNSLRLGDAQGAVDYLLHPTFAFDDAGYPIGGTRVPTPYFPSSSSFLWAVAMLAGGWEGAEGSHFPEGWKTMVEGFGPVL
ncbi:uncharacterized protein DNG_01586 [Cephalotrichum gorgonifer]|uniref:Six-hairpin glycosidase-like protein n=1 Tax=Cephalotrichum gorgonifer TaxID=2041049 RepID=A0AAE8SRT2_9PEZI|nr:uncharacterized protein DNG_01586 [Cephalotrichum gorgonifer]